MTYSITPLQDEFYKFAARNDIDPNSFEVAQFVFMSGALALWLMLQSKHIVDDAVEEMEAYKTTLTGQTEINPNRRYML